MMATLTGDLISKYAFPREWMRHRFVSIAILLAILILAAWFRTVGIAWALPHIPHPDEARIIDYVIVSAADVGKPVYSDYGSVAFSVLEVAGSLVGLIVPEYSLSDPGDAMSTYVLARAIAAAFGVATVALVYVLGAAVFDRKTGLMAAALIAGSALAIQLSHMYTVDVILAFWLTLFVILGVRLVQRPTDLTYVALMVVAGAAVATKFVALFLVAPIGVAVFQAAGGWDAVPRSNASAVLRHLAWRGSEYAGGLLIAAITFFILTPWALTNPQEFWLLDFNTPDWWHMRNVDHLLWNLFMTEGIVRPLWSLASVPDQPWIYPITNLLWWGIGPGLLLASVAGVVVAARRRTNTDLFLLSYLVAGFLTVSTSHVQFVRYVYPLVPVLVVLGSNSLFAVPRFSIGRNAIKAAMAMLAAIVLVSTLLYGVAFTNIYRTQDTRLQAEEWMAANVPEGATVGLVGPEAFTVPYVDFRPYRLHILPMWDLYYRSVPKSFPRGPMSAVLGSKLETDTTVSPLTDLDIQTFLSDHLQSDYLIISDLMTDQMEALLGPLERFRRYYEDLSDGSSGYQLVKTFKSTPQIFGIEIDDRSAEHTFRIFDHPTISVYRRQSE